MNRIAKLLKTKYPIVQGPMAGITLGEFASTVSEAGGLGVIASAGLSPEKLKEEIEKVKDRTDKPFAVNIPIYQPGSEKNLETALKADVGIIYTSAGSPEKYTERVKESGAKVIHKVSRLKEGLKAEKAGVDAVVAMGFEAGGIIGRSGVTSFCLIPELADNLSIPVVAAGGIADERGFAAALILGAEGVEIGTRLLATKECPVPESIKQAILKATCDSTMVIESPVVMRALKPELSGDSENPALGGQVSGLIKEILTVEEVIRKIAEGLNKAKF